MDIDLKERWHNYTKHAILKCLECDNKSVGLPAWRQHIASQHPQSQLAKTIKEVEADKARDDCKGRVGETSVPSEDTRGAKHQFPPPTTSPHAPASPSNSRSRARNNSDHQNTPERRLQTSDDDPRSTAPSNEAQDTCRQTRSQTRTTAAHQSSPQMRTDEDNTSVMIPQPETRPISQDQLVAEVKGIYAGLVMVEAKCREVDDAQFSNDESNPRLTDIQWQALIALHRTLLHEHHDFFLASQHPSANAALRRLASKYAMPARMWRHGIHSFLELLRHRLPASLEHMLELLYLAYNIVALLYETVPAFKDIWSECLGDLGRYRMAIEDDCIRDRETWTSVSRHWYSKASDKSPTAGRLYHHLAILARPDALQQLSYYTKSLCVPIPFPDSRKTIMTLFDPVLSKAPNSLAPIDAAFVRVHGILFSGKSKERLQESMDEFIEQFNAYVGCVPKSWLGAGYHIGISTGCSLLGYGAESNLLMRAISEEIDVATDGSSIAEANPDEIFDQALAFAVRIIETVMMRWGDVNTLPFLHTVLVFINHMTRFPAAIARIERYFPWKRTSSLLNFLLASLGPKYEFGSCFQPPENGQTPRPLPEDFAMRGLIYTGDYFPDKWFNNETDEDDKFIERRSMGRERKDRLITLGRRIATPGSWLIWDEETRRFSVPEEYEIDVEDPPKPIGEDLESDSESSQIQTLPPGPQYRLKVICARLGIAQHDTFYCIYSLIFSCVARVEEEGKNRGRDMEIDEAKIEVLMLLVRSQAGIEEGDSIFHCVFGCTYMAMGIKHEVEGQRDLAVVFKAAAKVSLEKALPDGLGFAVPASTTGTTTDGNAGDEAWRQLEQWLENYFIEA
ncbi:hypothetical protein CDV31_017109, partial [Fusarium ambrosium]